MDDSLLADLQKLGFDEKNYRTLSLLPLVMVAWADGRVQSAEVAEIERAAEQMQLVYGEAGRAMLHRWLTEPPGAEQQELGLRVLAELARRQEGAEESLDAGALRDLLDVCDGVASAAGRLFGLRDPVSLQEREALSVIARHLSIDTGHSWVELHRALA